MQPYYVEYIDDAARRSGLHPQRPRHAGARPPGGADRDRRHEGRAHAAARRAASWPTSPAASRRSARPARRRRTGRRSSSAPRRSCRPRCWCATPTATRRWPASPSSPPPASTACRAARSRPASGVHFMDAIGLERVGLDADWERPGPHARPPARLYLPGNECVFQVVAWIRADTEPPSRRRSRPTASRPVARSRLRRLRRVRLRPPAAPPPEPPATAPPTPPTGDADRRRSRPSTHGAADGHRAGATARRRSPPRPILTAVRDRHYHRRPMCSTPTLRCRRYRSTAVVRGCA